MNRRNFLFTAGTAAAGSIIMNESVLANPLSNPADIKPSKIPLWKGFNLTELFSGNKVEYFKEQDFQMMAEWGFNFARIPMSYWSWSKPDDWMKIDGDVFKIVDQVIEFGKQYHIHICLNLHRIPGYCINGREREPKDLFEGTEESRNAALNAAVYHWKFIAERYKDIPNDHLSYDLINEPPGIPASVYVPVAKALIDAIRKADINRLIFTDGLNVGTKPIPELIEMDLVQSTRGYAPAQITHYKASWVNMYKDGSWPEPKWPMHISDNNVWDKERIRKIFEPWKEIEKRGVCVHVGEWGVFNATPHPVTLAFMRDSLSIFKENNWGWALWNMRGSFGILNSGRQDVIYEDYKGHKLDKEMLELLREFV
jgi:endoglucanase